MSKQPSYPTNLSQQINQTQYQQPRLEPQRAGFDFNLSQYGNDINRFSGNNDAIMNGFTGQLQNMHPERSANMVDTNMSKGLVSCQPTTMGYSNIGNDNRQMNGGTAFPGNTYGIGNVFNSVNYSEQSATQQLDFNTLLSSESVKSAIDWLTTSNSALKLNSDDVIPDFCMNDAIGYAETHGLGIEVDSGFASLPPVAAPPAPLPKIRKIKKAPIKERAQYKRHATKDPINDQLLAIERLADARKHKRAAMLEKAMAMQNGALERASEQITRPARSQKARSYFTHTALESSTTMSENRNEVAEVIKKPRHAAAPVEIVGGEEFWEVECITKEKGKGATLKYFVKWKGFASSHNTWEPASEMIETAAEVVKEFKFKRKTLLS